MARRGVGDVDPSPDPVRLVPAAPSSAALAQAQAQAATPLRRSARAPQDGSDDGPTSSSSSAPAAADATSSGSVLVSLEHCGLAEPDGQVTATLLVKAADPSPGAAAAGCVGGAWQQFSFCEAALAWVRQGDLRHAASLLFRPAAAAAANDTDGAHGADAGAVPAVALRWQSASATASAPIRLTRSCFAPRTRRALSFPPMPTC